MAHRLQIVTGPATSTDAGYSGLNAADVSVANTDNDAAGVSRHADQRSWSRPKRAARPPSPSCSTRSRPPTSRSARPAMTRPKARSLPTSLTFTSGELERPQTVTRHGGRMMPACGRHIAYTVVTAAGDQHGRGLYNGINPSDVMSPTAITTRRASSSRPHSGLITTEAGGTATFTIVLNEPADGNVTIRTSSNDTTEGTGCQPASPSPTATGTRANGHRNGRERTGVEEHSLHHRHGRRTSSDTNYSRLNTV